MNPTMNPLLAAVVAALAIGGIAWMLRRTPPLLLSPAGAAARAFPPGFEDRRLEQHARWFIHMRWVAVLLATALVVSTVGLRFLPADVLAPLLLTLAAVAATNLVHARLLDRRRGLRVALAFQLYLDLGFLILLLHLSGGVENPLYLVPVFNVVLGGIALSRRQCFFLALWGGLACGTAVWAEWAHLLPHYTLRMVPHGEHGDLHEAYDTVYVAARTALQLLMMLLTARFVSGLAEQSRAHERGLAEAADQARAGRELLEQSLEATGTGLRVVDRTLRPLLLNAQWDRCFAAGTASGQALFAWSRPEGSPPRLTLADSVVRRTEVAVPAGAGEPRTFLVTTAPLHDREGGVDRAVELVQDVTEEKRMQARMLAACKLAAVGEVAGKLAHEINNPVSIVSAKARILLSDRRAEMSEKVVHELERIVALADRVSGVARGLLAYGRPSAAPRSPIDLAGPVRRALSLVEEGAARLGVRLVDDLGGPSAPVEASATEMEQVFLNLFLNALDAMPGGGILAVSSDGAGRLADGRPAVAIAVSDTGPGIPEDLRERVFEPFFTTKEEGRGSGLGLSICQGIVRAHGGEVAVEAGAGRGARFVVRLPVLAAGDQEADHG